MPPKTSNGAEQLRAYCAPTPRMTQAQLATTLGVSQQAVSMWVTGKARPSAHQREAIERITGIKAESWLSEMEREAVDDAVERAGELESEPKKNGTEHR